MYKNILLSTVAIVMFFGCAGSKNKPLNNKDLPEWYLNPPKFEDKFEQSLLFLPCQDV